MGSYVDSAQPGDFIITQDRQRVTGYLAQLAVSVIAQAFSDIHLAKSPNAKRRVARDEIVATGEEARRWLQDTDSYYVGSLAYWCRCFTIDTGINLSPEKFRDYVGTRIALKIHKGERADRRIRPKTKRIYNLDERRKAKEA